MGTLALSAGPLHAADADPARLEEGKTAFRAGVNLLQDPDGAKYDEALRQFRRAYEILNNWKVLGNLGICAMKLERDGEAIEAFDKYLAGGGKDLDKDERAQVERDLATLKAQVAKVDITLPASGVVSDQRTNIRGDRVVNDYPVSGTSVALGVHPGHHTIVARLPGGDVTWDVELNPGSSTAHTFETPKVAAAPSGPAGAVGTGLSPVNGGQNGPEHLSRPIPVTVFVAGGATVALAFAATITGVMALGKRSDFNNENGQPGKSKDEVQSLHDSAVTLGIVNTVLTGAAIAGAGVTAYFFLTRPTVTEKSATGVRVAPWMTTDAGGMSVSGRF